MPITESDLQVSWGTERWWRLDPLFRSVVVSDGVKHIMEAGLSWLVTDIAAITTRPTLSLAVASKAPLGYLLFWTLDVDTDAHTAVLTCRADEGQPAIVTKHYEFTDCPLKQVKIYSGHSDLGDPTVSRLLYMPSEY